MDGFERRKEQSKDNILRATDSLIAKFGLSKVSINDIARRASVSPVTIYNLFGGKDKLVHDYLEMLVERFMEQARTLMETDKSYLEKLEGIFRWEVEILESHPALNDEEIIKNPQFLQLATSARKQATSLLIKFVKQGQKQGYLNPDLSEEAIKAYFEVILQGLTTNSELHNRTHHNSKVFHDFILIMLYGFGRLYKPISVKRVLKAAPK